LEQEQLGEGAAGASEPLLQQVRPRYVTKTNRVECMVSFAEIVIVLDVNVLKLRKIYIFLIFVISPVRLTGKSVWGSCYSFLFYLVQFMGKIFDGTGGYCWVPWADFGSWVFEFITWVMHCSGFSLYRELDLRFSWVRSVCCGRAMPSVVVGLVLV
jgi:hypothetical protein